MTESSARQIDVFFYGLFMDEDLLRDKGINPLNRRVASVQDFKLVIRQRASLVSARGTVVHGIVFSLTHAEVDLLYSDPSVSMYRPEAVLAQLPEENSVPCLCFNLPAANTGEGRNHDYAAKLRALATQLNLPKSYVQTI